MSNVQAGWRWCTKCEALFFAGNQNQGTCPAGGGAHDDRQSGPYELFHNEPDTSGQHGWKWCRKCAGLFFAGAGAGGVCPAGGPHDGAQSGDYVLHDFATSDAGQPGWRWCRRCQGLFFAGGAGRGVCPASGAHDPAESGEYVLRFEAAGSATSTSLIFAAVRAHASLLLNAYVPSTKGDPEFEQITQGHPGSSCGFLCHWLLWRLGCSDRSIINRDEPSLGFQYRDGMNIARIWHNGTAPFKRVDNNDAIQRGARPETGDIVFIQNSVAGPPDSAHVFVFRDFVARDGQTFWRSWDAGQREGELECARPKVREVRVNGSRGATIVVAPAEAGPPRQSERVKQVIGWIPLTDVSYNCMPPIPPVTVDPLLLRPQ